MVELGAGELLVTSIDRDGTGSGFDTALLRAITVAVDVPVIASGGAAGPDDFVAAIRDGGADAVLAASIFHRRIHSIGTSRPRWRGRFAGPVAAGARRMTRPASIESSEYGDDGLVGGRPGRRGRARADGRVEGRGGARGDARDDELHFHSRSRDRLWRKGESSGNVLRLRDSALDCDGDAVLWQWTGGPRATRHPLLLRPRGLPGRARRRRVSDGSSAVDDDRRSRRDPAGRLIHRELLDGESTGPGGRSPKRRSKC